MRVPSKSGSREHRRTDVIVRSVTVVVGAVVAILVIWVLTGLVHLDQPFKLGSILGG